MGRTKQKSPRRPPAVMLPRPARQPRRGADNNVAAVPASPSPLLAPEMRGRQLQGACMGVQRSGRRGSSPPPPENVAQRPPQNENPLPRNNPGCNLRGKDMKFLTSNTRCNPSQNIYLYFLQV